MKNKVLVILGPTATGKTDLALDLAKKFDGELVACDSRQVYQGLDIGTGKLPKTDTRILRHNGYWEIDSIKIWMYDLVSLKVQYTVKDYVQKAQTVVEDILSRDKLPIIVGGTGFYLRALLKGIPNLEIPVDQQLRVELANLSLTQLQDKLKEVSLKSWNKLNQSDKQNPRRLWRAIERYMMNPYAPTENTELKAKNNWQILKIGLSSPRPVLYQKINARVLDWINQGIIEEVKKLRKEGISHLRIKDLGLEYYVVDQYLQGKLTEVEMTVQMQTKVRQYAKRQLTWFKREAEVSWWDITEAESWSKIEKKVQIWYYGQHEQTS